MSRKREKPSEASGTKLEIAVARIRCRFGPRSLVKGRLSTPSPVVPHISTGFPALDQALGIGGLPKGRLSELLGLPTSGKTTLALKFLVQAQANGGQVGYVDQARYFDPDYAHRCGLDLSRLVVGTPYDLREAMAMAEALACSGGLAALAFDVVDWLWSDPRGSAVPMAQQFAAWLKRLSAPLAHSGTALLFLHDGSPAGSTALSALSHFASVRLQVARESWRHRRGDVRGYEVRVEVLKNRLGPSGQVVYIVIEFNGTVRGDGL